ncbi:hypothetical protein ACFFX1_34020 [Dactylosporangium sucinum]|uniref:Secreted protein n=1 Tax=Dactylosporangium sucinum TaxID=1424081 RepID=A0A917UFH4_9ACTN|nr:hypothetical protein [Dactylosporangium sucinum]GGM80423.1 hypothetical protein GCM10007977_097380 [Dactylosporangium sucinum]
MTTTEQRLDQLRGPVPPVPHNARTIAALTTNPACSRRAVMDSAGVDKRRVAARVGFPPPYGQSPFTITRTRAFEGQVKANGCAELLRMLREVLDLSIPEVAYHDLEEAGGNTSPEVRHALARRIIQAAPQAGGTLFDHPLLRLPVGGRQVFLEPDLIAFRYEGTFYIVEIKSFAVIDGQADGGKVAAAAVQSAVYVIALRRLLEDLGEDPGRVSHDVVLVNPENFSNHAVATKVDVRRQLTVLERQLARMKRIDTLLEPLDEELTFDLVPDRDGSPTRPESELRSALGHIPARYSPDCLAMCELSYFCRDEARGTTHALGRSVSEELGSVEWIDTALALAGGRLAPSPEQHEAAGVLRAALRLRNECFGLPA